MRELTHTQATMEALHEEFRRNDKTVHIGTDIPIPLQKEFGKQRVRGTPISESAFVGLAIGLAGSGFRPVVNIRMATFGFVAMDQMVNQAAKITYMFGGQAKFPIVYRMSVGAGRSMAAQHSINPYSMYMNVPGLKIVLPSTPYDAKGLLKTSIRDNNPVIFFEHSALVGVKGEVPEEEYTIPFGQAKIRKSGTDVTVVALARMVSLALEVAEELERERISLEVIDLRTLVPLDQETVKVSAAKTGRLVVVDEACQTCGIAGEIISFVVEDEKIFRQLKSHPRRVCGLDVPIPFSPPLELSALPDKEKLTAAIRKVMEHPSTNDKY